MIELSVIAIITMAIGRSIGIVKGRPTAGLLWSMILGPIGWLLVALGPNLSPRCHRCGGIIKKGFKICCHCGGKIA